jgi:hypothetical protein
MTQQTLEGQLGRPVVVDMCAPCQSFWFDTHETLQLTPGGTLALFRIIGEQTSRRQVTNADVAKCPRCKGRLRLTHDMQRATRFTYLRCPNGHGRLMTFFDFLREKDFVRPLTPAQLAELRQNVQRVNCSGCGAPVDLATSSACGQCGAPLSMLDMQQASVLVAQLQQADARQRQPVSPALPLDLARARREVEAAVGGSRDAGWLQDVTSGDLVEAGLRAVARWMGTGGS